MTDNDALVREQIADIIQKRVSSPSFQGNATFMAAHRMDQLQAADDILAALRSPAPMVDGGCYCKDTCGAPVIMGRQTRCLRNPPLRPGEAVVRGNEATRPQPAQDDVEPFAWVDVLSWHQLASRAVMASVKLGSWMSAALDDPAVCDEMKADIREWFSAGEPMEILTAAIAALRQHSGESALREALEKCCAQFEFYAKEHAEKAAKAKAEWDGARYWGNVDEQAEKQAEFQKRAKQTATNQEFVELCCAALGGGGEA